MPSLPLDVARDLAKNFAMSIPFIRNQRLKRMSRTTALDVRDFNAEVEKFACLQWDFFQNNVPGGLSGKTIVEIGPGDVVGMGILALLHGANMYIVYDRFAGNIRSPDACRLYRLLAERHGFHDAPSVEGFATAFTDRLIERREAIETANITAPEADVVLSFNVVEHLYDVEKAFAQMAALLKPGGVMIHRVDYSAHGPWSRYPNRLTFLTIPSPLWRMMGSQRGESNRRRHSHILEAGRKAGLEMRTIMKGERTISPQDIAAVRHKLCRDLRACSDEDLQLLDAGVIGIKPLS